MALGSKHIKNAHRPKMKSGHRGRTWDTIRVILPDGQEIRGSLDTTWGNYIYFPVNGKWYKTSVWNAEERVVDLREEPSGAKAK